MIRLKKQNTNDCIKEPKKGKGANRSNGKNLKKFKSHGFCVKGKGKKVHMYVI